MGTWYIKDQAFKNVTRMSTRRARKRDEKGTGDTTDIKKTQIAFIRVRLYCYILLESPL